MASVPGSYSQLVRDSALFVAQNASHVTIDEAAMKQFVDRLDREELKELGSPMSVPLRFENDAQLTNFWSLVDLINFGSGYRLLLKQHTGRGAYDTILGGMLSWHLSDTRFDASTMANISLGKIAEIFQIPVKVEVAHESHPAITTYVDGPLKPLVSDLWKVVRSSGQILLNAGHADFAAFLAAHQGGEAQDLLRALVDTFPAFRDCADYKGKQVHIYKKAQLLVCDLHRQVPGFKTLQNVDSLTVFTDNVLPCVFRQLGLLKIDQKLLEHIDSAEVLTPGDDEIELRLCAVHACEMIKDMADLSIPQLDYYLWRLGKKTPEFRDVHRHYTQDTIFY